MILSERRVYETKMKYLYILLVFVPVTIAGKLMGMSDAMLFVCSSLAIVPLAGTP